MSGRGINFTWDPNKAHKNLMKHRITFEMAIEAFDDPLAATFRDTLHSIDEERFILIGRTEDSKTLLVVYTSNRYNDPRARLISARLATKKERLRYEEGI
jgi:uncharacterized protein